MDGMSSIKVSFSESDAVRQCRLKHHLAYTERWRTEDTPIALARGTALHAAMEFHYAILQTRDPLEMSDADFLPRIEEALLDAGMLPDGEEYPGDPSVTWMYEGYRDFYGTDNAWEILAVELEFEVPLYDHTGAESEFYLVGKIDVLVRNRGTGKIFVVDHKTCSNLPTEKALDFDEQMALYTIAGRRMGFEVYGAIYNAIRSKKLVRAMTPEERFSRKIVTKTDFELAVVEHELVETMRDVHRPREIDPPRSPNSDTCNWKCNFREACLAGRKSGPVRMREFLRDTGFKQSDKVPPFFASGPIDGSLAKGGQMDLLTELAKVDPRQGDTVTITRPLGSDLTQSPLGSITDMGGATVRGANLEESIKNAELLVRALHDKRDRAEAPSTTDRPPRNSPGVVAALARLDALVRGA